MILSIESIYYPTIRPTDLRPALCFFFLFPWLSASLIVSLPYLAYQSTGLFVSLRQSSGYLVLPTHNRDCKYRWEDGHLSGRVLAVCLSGRATIFLESTRLPSYVCSWIVVILRKSMRQISW